MKKQISNKEMIDLFRKSDEVSYVVFLNKYEKKMKEEELKRQAKEKEKTPKIFKKIFKKG